MKIKPVHLFVLMALLAVFFLLSGQGGFSQDNTEEFEQPEVIKRYRQVGLEITPNSTYGVLMSEAGVEPLVAKAIFEASKEAYDLSNIRVGRVLNLYYDKETDELIQLMYQIDSEEELYVVRTEAEETAASSTEPDLTVNWQAERKKIDYDLKEKTVEGVLETSLYQWALDNGVDVRAIIDLADAYQWTIDFAIDPRVGDSFKFIYQERYRNGEYIMPANILAAKYINSGQEYRIYYFEESAENQGFFDPAGNSVQRELLKAPIQYKYITSGFTTGLRCLESYGLCTNHRAIDYAAPIGTPIRAVGDGTVVFAGWNSGGYGYLTTIRHNETFTTNYAHQSSILVRAGQKVSQGEIIGKVGSTGLSTGPHLHYEIVKHGVKINPLTLELPPGEPIKEENRPRFFEIIGGYQNRLN